MSAPSPEHIDAVARVGDPHAFARNVPNVGEQKRRQSAAWRSARNLLDSTDPAVHAAMLDALTRHGVLTEVFGTCSKDDDGTLGTFGGPPDLENATACAKGGMVVAHYFTTAVSEVTP